MGFCLPIECKTEDLDYFTKTVFGWINGNLAKLPSLGINLHIGVIFDSRSRLGAKFTVPHEYN